MGQDAARPERLAELEALLFASDAPLPVERIAEVLEVSVEEARAGVEALRLACEAPDRGVAVVEVGGGVRLVTRSEHAPVLLRLQRLRLKSRLSRAAVETLAIVAYRQPISRPEIEQLRGVGTESVLTHLLERRLIRVVGRKAAPGRPVLYGTTREFLEHFGLNDLRELPPFEVPAEAARAGADGAAAGEAAGATSDTAIAEPGTAEPGAAEPGIDDTEVDATEARDSAVGEDGAASPFGDAPAAHAAESPAGGAVVDVTPAPEVGFPGSGPGAVDAGSGSEPLPGSAPVETFGVEGVPSLAGADGADAPDERTPEPEEDRGSDAGARPIAPA